jgi:hypothetical protein
MKLAVSTLGLVVVAALAGCGGSDGGGSGGGAGTGGNGASCTVSKGFCGALTVPSSYNATAVKVIIGLYKQLGAGGPAGPPDAIAMQAANPTISPTTSFELMPTALTVSGDYFVYAALYVQGGGMFEPVKGVDYVAQTTKAVTLGGAASPDIGTLALTLAQ